MKLNVIHVLTYSLRSFLLNKDGNPNKRNVHNETSLHLLCMGRQILISEGALQPRLSRPYEDERRRAECLKLILSWTGAKLDRGEYESADINATDNKKNTCLHYAAASGMRTCVEVRLLKFMHIFPKIFFCVWHFNVCFKKLYKWKLMSKAKIGSNLSTMKREMFKLIQIIKHQPCNMNSSWCCGLVLDVVMMLDK